VIKGRVQKSEQPPTRNAYISPKGGYHKRGTGLLTFADLLQSVSAAAAHNASRMPPLVWQLAISPMGHNQKPCAKGGRAIGPFIPAPIEEHNARD
jgi:hypothetical protein